MNGVGVAAIHFAGAASPSAGQIALMNQKMPNIMVERPTLWRSIAAVAGVSLSCSIVLGATLCSLSTLLVYAATSLQLSVAESSRLTAGFFVAMTAATPLVGWLCRFLHPAFCMGLGTLVAGASYGVAAQARSAMALLAALLMCGVGVAAASYVPATLLISRWVSRHRGLAFASLLSACALGASGFPLLTDHLCVQLGWHSALKALGYAVVALCLPCLAGVKLLGLPPTPTEAASPGVPRGLPIRSAAFLGLTALQMLAGLSYTSVYFFIVPYLIDAGYTSAFAASVFGSIGLVSVCGFFLNGLLADRCGAHGVLLVGLLVCAISTLALLLVPSSVDHAAIVLFVLAWGATFNISSQLAPILLIESLGMQRFGECFGLTNFFTGLASALGPLITGYLHDQLNGYGAAFVLSAAVMALAALPLVFRLSPDTDGPVRT